MKMSAAMAAATEPIGNSVAVEYLSLSIFLGALLTLVNDWANQKVSPLLKNLEPSSTVTKKEATTANTLSALTHTILNASNVLFLCFGMAGIMILVNNNLARAFAIGAAIALVRFKNCLIHTDLVLHFFLESWLGMACGVGQGETAIAIALAFCTIQAFIVALICKIGERSAKAEVLDNGSTDSSLAEVKEPRGKFPWALGRYRGRRLPNQYLRKLLLNNFNQSILMLLPARLCLLQY